MSTIFHFGDSFGTTSYTDVESPKHFVNICADNIGYEYINFSERGISNEMILNKLLKNIYSFKKNDIVFINFSYLVRGCFYSEKDRCVKSTNILYDETHNKEQFYNADNEKVLKLFDYYLNETEDYNRRIFLLFNTLIGQLINKGIKVFYIHIDNLFLTNNLLDVGNNIIFEDGFYSWLFDNGLVKGGEGHYTPSIQEFIANEILNRTNNLNKKLI